MADETEDKNARQDSDVKQSFAWGQLFAGSLIGGLAVWKLLHKMTNTEPSEWFAGLSVAYEEARDFLMTPFSWIQLDLTVEEKNIATVSLVLIAAIARSARRDGGAFAFIAGTMVVFVMLYVSALQAAFGDAEFMQSRRNVLYFVAGLLAFFSLAVPLAGIIWRGPAVLVSLWYLVLLSVCFTVGWGTILLLLNWATS